MRELCYALFHCDPFTEPPFEFELGFSDHSTFSINGCDHIPDALEKLDLHCTAESIIKAVHFTLLYPIYLKAMESDVENKMHMIASLIKTQADDNKWNFGRIGGYTGMTPESYLSNG